MAVGQRPCTVTFVVDSYGDGLQDDGEAVPFLGGFDQWWGQIVQLNGVRSQVVRLSVKLFRRHADEALVDPVVTEVTGDFLYSEEVWLRLQDAVDLTPEVALRPVGWWWVAVQKSLEAVYDGLVVDEHMHWPFSGGHQVQEGKRFGALGVLSEAVHARRIVEPMLVAIVNAKSGAGEEGDGLVRTRPVGAGVDPATTRDGGPCSR